MNQEIFKNKNKLKTQFHINSEWKEVALSDITSIIADGLHGTPQFDDKGGYFFINGNNLNQGKIIIKSDTKRVTEGEAKKYSKPLSDKTILLSINGTLGNLALYNNEKCMLGKSACYINVNEENDRKFLYYVFLSKDFQSFIIEHSTGTTIPNMPLKGLRSYTFYIPSLPEQRAIASILSSLDDKIDLLHQQNQTLEKMAETLFRQWFVEEVKEDWEEGKFSNEFDFTMGQSPPGDSYNEVGVGTPMYQGNADFGFRFPNNRVFTTAPSRFAQKYDTLISVRAPVGAQNMANENCCIGRGVAAFRYKKNHEYYTYTYFKLKSLIEEIKQFNETGTVFGSISKSDFEAFTITIPPDNKVNNFQIEVKPIDDKIISNTHQIRTLSMLRNSLLPKLMSGKIKV